MKKSNEFGKVILFSLLALITSLSGASAQTVRRDIVVDGNGTLVASTNFWPANQPGIASALSLGSLATQNGTFSGNSSGNNTGDQTTISGNAGTATALQTARTINGVSFNGTANIIIPAAGSTLTDTVPVGKGGTGAATLTGYVKGNGTANMTASSTIPVADITGLSTVATSGNKTDIGLGNVENTALSTWAGSGNITTLGTIASGTVPVARVSGLGTAATSNATAFVASSNGTSTNQTLTTPNIGAATGTSLSLSGNLTLSNSMATLTNNGSSVIGANLTVNGNTTLGDALGDTMSVAAGALAVNGTGQVTAAYQAASANQPMASTGVITPDTLIFETATLGILRPGTTWQLANSTAISKSVTAAIVAGVVTTTTAHGFVVGDAVVFSSLTNPANMANGTTYWVASAPTTTTFTFSASLGGAAITTATADAGSATVATSAWSAWYSETNNFWAQIGKQQSGSTGAGWARVGIYNFLLNSGEANNTPSARGFTVWFRQNIPSDTLFATDIYFGSQLTEVGGPLAARGLRVSFQPSGANQVVIAGIHNGTTETTATSASIALFKAVIIRWFPQNVVGGVPGSGSYLEVWTVSQTAGSRPQLRCTATIGSAFNASTFAGSAFAIVARSTGTTPGYTANWEIGGITCIQH